MKKIVAILLMFVVALGAEEVYASFFVEASKSANLAIHAGGVVKAVYVDVAQSVKKGQKLVELANDESRASLEVAKTDVDNAQVALKYAQRDYERQEKVKHLLDEGRFDSFSLALERARTSLAHAKANYEYKKTLFEKSVLYAPFDGVVFEKSVEIGDVVTEMSPKTIIKLQSRSDRKLIVEFDQKYWKMVKVGQLFKYKIDGDSREYQAKISKVYPLASSQNRKIKAEARVSGVVVGLFGDGYITAK